MEENVEAALVLIFRVLKRRVGEISLDAESQICTLSLPQLEELGEALLDFEESNDLGDWLRSR
jgi:hypothetical protein